MRSFIINQTTGEIINHIILDEAAQNNPATAWHAPDGFSVVEENQQSVGQIYNPAYNPEEIPALPPEIPPAPITVSATKFLITLRRRNFINDTEAVDRSSLPAFMTAAIAGLTADEASIARIRWATMTNVSQDEPLVSTCAAILNLSDSDVQAFFEEAAAVP